jgi:hypothetical protein
MTNWFLIVNAGPVAGLDEGTILAVYGAALGEEAQLQARELSKLGSVALRLVATRKRPAVGSKIGKRSLSIAFEGVPS